MPETFFVVFALCFASHDVEGNPDRKHFGPNNLAIELDITVVHSDLIFDNRYLVHDGFFFSYGSIPVTEQCETVRLIWGRQSAIGQNPVAPYFFQVFTSSFVFPFVVDAGQGGDAGDGNLFFDFTVPFAPGTQYQICMYDSNGLPGGCQVLFTMIQNSTDANPTCKNMTMPNQVLDVNGVVDGGPMSQNGFINQPLNGTPPFTLTVSPPNHPPYNITSLTMDPIVWTVSLSRAMPFFLSLVSSEGLVWANGPMGVGRSDDDTCLAPDAILKAKAHSIATAAGVGGLFGGLFLAGVAWIVQRCWSRRQNTVDGKSSILPWYDGNISGHSSTNVSIANNSGTLDMNQNHLQPADISPMSSLSSTSNTSQRYIRYPDGGRGTSPNTLVALPEETTPAAVELPPKYVVREDAPIPHMLTEKPLHRLLVASE
ncbi:hypothetical protein EV368DRAFT_88407 [Lentinula lateritia]|nr:hypothetical protein EV368DRAFT_88407 [Lentinula lateritia]